MNIEDQRLAVSLARKAVREYAGIQKLKDKMKRLQLVLKDVEDENKQTEANLINLHGDESSDNDFSIVVGSKVINVTYNSEYGRADVYITKRIK